MTAGFSWAPEGHREDVSRQPEKPADSSALGRRFSLTLVLLQQHWAGGPMCGPSEMIMATVMAGKAGAEREGA